MSSKPAADGESTFIEFTDEAIEEAHAVMEGESLDPDEFGLRIIAQEKNCDCGSLAYGLRFDPQQEAEDTVGTVDGISVVVDPESYEHVEGATVDYVSEPDRSGFLVETSHSEEGCGCGGHHH